MRLGTQTNSVVNHLHARGVIGQPEPTIGMGVTILGWSDRHPGTIVEIFTIGKNTAIRVQADDYKLVSGSTQSESQGYEFTPNPNGSKSVFMREADGTWHEMTHKVKDYIEKPRFKNGEQIGVDHRPVLSARWSKTRGHGLRIGERGAYYDPTF
jgi:hypothetical protein